MKQDKKVLLLHLELYVQAKDFYNDEYNLQMTQNLEHLKYKIHVKIYRSFSDPSSPCPKLKARDLFRLSSSFFL